MTETIGWLVALLLGDTGRMQAPALRLARRARDPCKPCYRGRPLGKRPAGSIRAPWGCPDRTHRGTPDGLRITDVWKSRTQFDNFYDNVIKPAAKLIDIPQPKHLDYYEAANYLYNPNPAGSTPHATAPDTRERRGDTHSLLTRA